MASPPLPAPPRPAFIEGLKSGAAKAEYADADRLAHRMLVHYGCAELYEWYKASLIGKVVFDVDGHLQGDTTAEALLRDALAGVETFFGFMPQRILVAAAHGQGEGHPHGDKLSFRIYVQGYRMVMADVKKRLVRLGLDKNRPFDAAIYGANQKLRMAGSIKTKQDRRPLKLINPDHSDLQPTEQLLLDTLVQVVDPDWPLLEEPSAEKPQRQEKKAKRPADPVATGVAPALTAPAITAPAAKRQRGRPPKHLSISTDHAATLREMGYVRPKFVSATDDGFTFTADNRDCCPNCTHDHQRNNWWFVEKQDAYLVCNYSERCVTKTVRKVVEAIVPVHQDFDSSIAALDIAEGQQQTLARAVHYHQAVVTIACDSPNCLACDQHHASRLYFCNQIIPRDCWTLRNHDVSCPGRVFHHSPNLQAIMRTVLEGDLTDTKLAGLYLHGHTDKLHLDMNTNVVSQWQVDAEGAGRWMVTSQREFHTHVSWWFTALFSGIKHLPDFADHAKSIAKVVARLDSHMKNIVYTILGTLEMHSDKTSMDTDPYLLGTDNGVIELKTGLLRPARPEDRVTKSVGYAIPPDGYGDVDAVDAVFRQIYPVESERHFFQLYGGYCLLGNCRAKGFMCLTDRRDGDNAKSTVVSLLAQALGDDYTSRGKDDLLYETRYATGLNQHNSGWIAFHGKRLAIMEELKTTRTLDTDLLKELTGGETKRVVRAAGSQRNWDMPWTAKLITIFNEGRMPKLDTDDGAFAKRLIVMPHRALFCKTPEEFERRAGEDHTFLADGGRIAVLTKPALLGWFLQGLQRYWSSGHVEFQVPSSCTQWTQDLVRSQDAVVQWIGENFEEGGVHDFVTLKAVHELMQSAAPEIRVGPRVLKAKLQRVWSPCKDQHYVQQERHVSAYIGMRRREAWSGQR